jgi:DNA-binding NarL/FixJ family response regulator
MKSHKPAIAILSDQTLFRQGLRELLRAQGFRHTREVTSSGELARGQPPDIVFIDLDHEREDTMSLMRKLRHDLAGTHIVVIGTALRQGAADVVPEGELETPRADSTVLGAAARRRSRRSSPEVLRQRRVWSGITPRQRDVLRWMPTGADNRTIGRKLRVGERAIKAHISALLSVFGLANRTQLALLAERAGLRPPWRA